MVRHPEGTAGALAFLYALEKGKKTVRLDKVLDVLAVLGLELRLERGTGGIVVTRSDVKGSDEEPARS